MGYGTTELYEDEWYTVRYIGETRKTNNISLAYLIFLGSYNQINMTVKFDVETKIFYYCISISLSFALAYIFGISLSFFRFAHDLWYSYST